MSGGFRISVELGELIPPNAPFTRDLFPALAHSVERIAGAVQQQWVAYASGAALPNGRAISPRSGEYAKSIHLEHTGDFAARVFSMLPYAHAIEEGTPARDMKRMLASSYKVRLTKDGRRYLIIPFRWNNPAAVSGRHMTALVWEWWKHDDRAPSAVTAQYRRFTAPWSYDVKTRERMTTPAWSYRWGARLKRTDLEAMGATQQEVRRMTGMVNFRKPGGEGGSSHSQFITFRTMMEGSPGWIAPARQGLHPARTTAEQFRPIAEQAFKRAVEEDVARLIGAADSS